MRDRQCALNHDAPESAAIVSGVINKTTTVALCNGSTDLYEIWYADVKWVS